jgi:hypothetical protein
VVVAVNIVEQLPERTVVRVVVVQIAELRVQAILQTPALHREIMVVREELVALIMAVVVAVLPLLEMMELLAQTQEKAGMVLPLVLQAHQ